MEDMIPLVLIIMAIVFIMYKNLEKVTSRIDNKEDVSFELYSKYAVKIEEYLREIKNDIEKRTVMQNPKYSLKNEDKKEDISNAISDIIRKVAFFETVMAKRKGSEQIEEELFKILNSLDELIGDEFKNGKETADNLKEELFEEFNRLKSM